MALLALHVLRVLPPCIICAVRCGGGGGSDCCRAFLAAPLGEAFGVELVVLVAGGHVHALVPVDRPLDEDEHDHVSEHAVREGHHRQHLQVQVHLATHTQKKSRRTK